MDNDTACKFINSIVKNLQLLCHSNVNFSQNIEIIGHLYLNVDSGSKYNYFVNEKVCKNDESSTVFVSNSFHAEPVKNCVSNNSNSNDENQMNEDEIQTTKVISPNDTIGECGLKARKIERFKTGMKPETICISEKLSTPPAKHPRLDFTINTDDLKQEAESEHYSTSDFNQFNVSYSSSFLNEPDASQTAVTPNDNPPIISSPTTEQSTTQCIDLADIKREPDNDDDDDDDTIITSEYIRNQQNILQGGSYLTDEESLSSFSGSNEQILNLYSVAVNQHNSRSINNLSTSSTSILPDSSPHNMILPQIVHGSPSSLSREDNSYVQSPINMYYMIKDEYGCDKFACSKCETVFSARSSFIRHFNEKHLNFCVVCPFCGHKFTQKSSLRRHVLKVHNEQSNSLTTT